MGITCRPGELSAGLGAYYENLESSGYIEQIYRSIVLGTEKLTIEAGKIEQIGSVISGGSGYIKALVHEKKDLPLTSESKTSAESLSIGVSVGFGENISALVRDSGKGYGALEKFDRDNPFGPVNLGFAAWNIYLDMARLWAGGIISFGAWPEFSAQKFFAKEKVTKQVPSLALIGELEENLDKYIRVADRERSSRSLGIGYGPGGFSVSFAIEEDGNKIGASYGGGRVGLLAAEGSAKLDAEIVLASTIV